MSLSGNKILTHELIELVSSDTHVTTRDPEKLGPAAARLDLSLIIVS